MLLLTSVTNTLLLLKFCATFLGCWNNLHCWHKCFSAIKIIWEILHDSRIGAPSHDECQALNILKLLLQRRLLNWSSTLWSLFQLRSSYAANSSCSYGDLCILISWIYCCCAFLSSFLFFNFVILWILFIFCQFMVTNVGMQKHFFTKNWWLSASNVTMGSLS